MVLMVSEPLRWDLLFSVVLCRTWVVVAVCCRDAVDCFLQHRTVSADSVHLASSAFVQWMLSSAHVLCWPNMVWNGTPLAVWAGS